jgi:hypothetical protein
MQRWENELKEIFKNDLFIFLMSEKTYATATEISTRNDEKLLLLAPVLERIHTELLIPIIDKSLELLMNGGFLPQPPDELVGMEIRPSFVGVLAQAQLQHNTQAINTTIGTAMSIAQGGYPQIFDKIDFEQAIDASSIINGVPPRIIRSDDDVAQIREQRAAQEAEMREAQEAMAGVQAIKDTSEAARNVSQAAQQGAA